MQDYLAPFVPSPPKVIKKMLEVSRPKPGEILYDLGSGEGDVVREAAKRYGLRCVGIESDPKLVKSSREMILREGLEGLVEIKEENILKYPLNDADIVTTYLTPRGMEKIEGKVFSELKPSARLVSHEFNFKDVKPNETHIIFTKTEFPDSQLIPQPIFHWINVYRMDEVKRKKPRRFSF